MPVRRGFTPSAIGARIAQMVERRKKAMIAQLFYIGEECLAQARSGHRYLSRTGNLCSSVGYCILDDGQIVGAGDWQSVPGPDGDGSEGRQRGEAYLHELASKQPQKGIVFLMVAGMPYAKYVEAMSLDVLDTSEQMAQRKVRAMLNRMFKNA